jgi:hypothetical protein
MNRSFVLQIFCLLHDPIEIGSEDSFVDATVGLFEGKFA